MIRPNRPIPLQSIKLLVFDLDGTLIDSRIDLANSVNAMLREFGRPELPIDLISSYIGDGAPMLVRRALGDPDDEQFFKEALDFFLAWYRAHKLDNTYVYPGLIDALSVIRAARPDLQMAVLTNKPVVPSRAIVDALGLGDFFFQVYGGNSFPTKKPDPQGAQVLLNEARATPQQAIMIGDSDIDTVTGQSAGMWTLGVLYGFKPHTLESPVPDMLVEHPPDLAEVFVRVTTGAKEKGSS